jgi:hypothetical protein
VREREIYREIERGGEKKKERERERKKKRERERCFSFIFPLSLLLSPFVSDPRTLFFFFK